MDKQRCMLAYTSESLLGNGMSKLLEFKPDLDVISLKIETEAGLFQAVQQMKPQVLVIESHCLEKDEGLIGRIMAQLFALRVIVVSLEDNSLHVYERQRVKVRHVDDFISAIFPKTGPIED